jgi:hypothetical protein
MEKNNSDQPQDQSSNDLQIIQDMESILNEAQIARSGVDLEVLNFEADSLAHSQTVLLEISANVPNVFDDVEELMQGHSDKDPLEVAAAMMRLSIDKGDSLDSIENAVLYSVVDKLQLVSNLSIATDPDLEGLALSKSEIQLSIIESHSYSPEEKKLVLDFIDQYLEGESIDPTDPDAMMHEMLKVENSKDQNELEANKAAIVRNAVKNELEKYTLQKEDPVYAYFFISVCLAAEDGTPLDEAVVRLKESALTLGINVADLKQSINTIRKSISVSK